MQSQQYFPPPLNVIIVLAVAIYLPQIWYHSRSVTTNRLDIESEIGHHIKVNLCTLSV
jgi:hypothetical protein